MDCHRCVTLMEKKNCLKCKKNILNHFTSCCLKTVNMFVYGVFFSCVILYNANNFEADPTGYILYSKL